MIELAKEKINLLLKDLEEMQQKEKETGRQYFTFQLFAIRVKEIVELLNKKEEE